MAKYSKKLKLRVVKEYQNGEISVNSLTIKYDIKNKSEIYKWIRNYENFGEQSLERSVRNKSYSTKFKMDVLNYKVTTNSSLNDTAIRFGIEHPSMISSWMRKFNEEGLNGLNKTKGRPPKMKNNKPVSNVETKDLEEAKLKIKILEDENKKKDLEILYLKKLDAYLRDQQDFTEKGKSK